MFFVMLLFVVFVRVALQVAEKVQDASESLHRQEQFESTSADIGSAADIGHENATSAPRRLANFVSYTIMSQHGSCFASPGTALSCGVNLRYFSSPYTSSTDLTAVTGATSGSCVTTGSNTTRYSASGDGLVRYLMCSLPLGGSSLCA
jgi:hypothetical protein